MKIIVACKGRSHLLDCCRELQKLGHDVTFYTATPRKNFRKYGLVKGGVSFAEVLAPIILLSIYLPCNFTRAIFSYAIDMLVCLFMRRCDVFIAASPDFTWAMKWSRKRYKSVVILDRGANHVRIFNEMSMMSGQPSMTEWYMKLDENQYKLADYIAVGSDYVKDCFLARGISQYKLFSNPYGVNFNEFHPTIWTGEFDFIYVGRWSKRKGCNLIIQALKGTKYKFIHVGAIDDMAFPDECNFLHIEPVPQSELINYYTKAKTFLFPTYDEGFGMVLCQAAACGLHIIASRNCGSTTMLRLLGGSFNIQIMNELTVECLKANILMSEKNINSHIDVSRNQNTSILNIFSWKSYGERLNNFLLNVMQCK